MKTIILSGILFALSVNISQAQEIPVLTKEKTTLSEDSSKYFIGFGLNTIDNGESKLPFNTKDFAFKIPFFLSLERKIKSNYSVALTFATNSLKMKSTEKFYFGMDVSGRYYFDEYLFKNENIETYAGLGLGQYYLEDNGNTTFNLSLGGRYWFAKNFAVSLQGIGKAAFKPVNSDVRNYYEYNLGIVWRNSSSNKKIK